MLRSMVFLHLALPLAGPLLAQGSGSSLRFFGTGDQDIDRVKVRIDSPEVPADISMTVTETAAATSPIGSSC